MFVLAMILTAAMVVPGDGPEKVSGELAEPQRLDLRGEWELDLDGCRLKPMSRDDLIRALRIQDKGGGNVRMHFPKFGVDNVRIAYTGTYRQEGDRVVIHFRILAEKDSAVYRENISKGCIILTRLKSHE